MTRAIESQARGAVARDYAALLREYVEGGGEAALVGAYELGRRAATGGVGLIDMVMVHHEALLELPSSVQERSTVDRAAQLFAESLAPFEVTLRAYQANARLLGLSETLEKQNVEIDRAREHLRAILDATTAVIYLKNAQGQYVFVNRQFQTVFGVCREQMIGKTDEDVLPSHIARTLRDNDRGVIEKQVPQELEETIVQDDGPHTYISLKFPLLDAAGSAHAVCCVSTDITERKRADEALRRAKEATEDANRELESFSYSVAHDLRAPLRSIDGFSQALLDDWAEKLDAQGKKYLKHVRESAQQMSHLIDDLLALSRLSRGDVRRLQVDLSALAHELVERLQDTEPERRVTVVIHDGVVGHGDPTLLRAVLENLLGNAWKFTAKRELAHIEFGQTSDGARASYFVRDNGAGFDMAYAAKLFGVFQRLHSSDDFEGNGIGLATVQRIIRRHGGRVWAEGAVDRGATFSFTLGDGEIMQ